MDIDRWMEPFVEWISLLKNNEVNLGETVHLLPENSPMLSAESRLGTEKELRDNYLKG
jgi:hypothetical protein